jgi:hypothetical protein
MPVPVLADDIPQDRWTRGLAIIVANLVTDFPIKNARITVRYDDGVRVDTQTEPMGWAILPVREGKKAMSVTFAVVQDPGRDTVIEIGPRESGVVSVTLDTDQLTEPAFAAMRLQINGNTLIPESGDGRYARRDQ